MTDAMIDPTLQAMGLTRKDQMAGYEYSGAVDGYPMRVVVQRQRYRGDSVGVGVYVGSVVTVYVNSTQIKTRVTIGKKTGLEWIGQMLGRRLLDLPDPAPTRIRENPSNPCYPCTQSLSPSGTAVPLPRCPCHFPGDANANNCSNVKYAADAATSRAYRKSSPYVPEL